MIADETQTNILVIGRGEAELGGADRYGKGLERKLRYADAVAWTIKGAVEAALARLSGKVDAVRDSVGLATASDVGPRDTIAEVALAARRGQCSPLRFAAANPGSVAGVACVAFGFRGPTRNLVMSPAYAAPLLLMFADCWLDSRIADIALLSTFSASPPERAGARCVALAREEFGADNVCTLELAANWLSMEEPA
jgi:hypothetical protein